MDHPGGKLSQLDKKASFHFLLLSGQAGIDANDRREMDEMLLTKPKTIVVVFTAGRQTGDISVHATSLSTGSLVSFWRNTCLWDGSREGKSLGMERETGGNVCRMSSRWLIF